MILVAAHISNVVPKILSKEKNLKLCNCFVVFYILVGIFLLDKRNPAKKQMTVSFQDILNLKIFTILQHFSWVSRS